MYTYNYTCLKNMAPIVTISALSIAFNKGAVDMLSSPAKVIIGFDKEHKVIGITPVDEMSDSLGKNIPIYEFGSRLRNEWVRIGAKDFIRYLSEITGISFKKAVQFSPSIDEDGKTLMVFVDKDHMRKTID